MKTKSTVTEDPVVSEVRRIRAQLWREGGGTVAGLLRLLQPPNLKRPSVNGKRARRRTPAA
jgi:hypothetical protein